MSERCEIPGRALLRHLPYPAWLSPAAIGLNMALAGEPPPPIATYCEPVRADRLTLAIHAACNPSIAFHGGLPPAEDDDVARVLSNNQELQNFHLSEAGVAAFGRADSGPDFDVVTFGGAWSYLPEKTQHDAGRLVESRLAAGGVVCLDHRTLPGQRQGCDVAETLYALCGYGLDRGDPAAVHAALPEALARFAGFSERQPLFETQNWGVRQRIRALAETDIDSVAHAYLNPDFKPRYFRETAAFLHAYGLAWSCPLLAAAAIDHLTLSPEQAAGIAAVPGKIERQQLKDFAINRRERRDVWRRAGARRVVTDRTDLCAGRQITAVRPAEAFHYSYRTATGDIALARAVYGPILDRVDGGRPVTIGELFAEMREAATPDMIMDAIAILFDLGWVHPVNPDASDVEAAIPATRSLNRQILEAARDCEADVPVASPLTGGGVPVSRLHRLFLLARLEGANDAPGYAASAEARPAVDTSGRARRDALDVEAARFADQYLECYRRLLLVT